MVRPGEDHMSSRRTWGAVALAVSALCGCTASGTQENSGYNDVQIAKALVGAWSGEVEDNGAKVKAVTRYKSDGTFEGEAATPQAGEKSPKGTTTGTWMVENGVLIETVEKSKGSRTAKRGQVRKSQVLSIDDKELKYKTEKGQEGVRNRIP